MDCCSKREFHLVKPLLQPFSKFHMFHNILVSVSHSCDVQEIIVGKVESSSIPSSLPQTEHLTYVYQQ